jgi:hypothetical protein
VSFLVEDLIQSAKDRTLAPISQNTFETADLVRIHNEEMLLKLVSDIMSVREDFFLSTKTTSLVGGVARYQIPKRAVGNTLKAVFFQSSTTSERKLEKVDVEDRDGFAGQTGDPECFYLEGDEVVLLPTPAASSGSLIFSYYAKPNRLIETSSCAKITNVSSAGGLTTFTVDTDLSADLSVGDKVDFLSGVSPYLLWADEVSITAITASTIEVATTSVDNEAGTVEPQDDDYICPTGYANIPMIPEEFHPVLAQMGAVRVLAALGHLDKWQAAKAELQELRKESLRLIKNRVESSPDMVVHRNGLVNHFRR